MWQQGESRLEFGQTGHDSGKGICRYKHTYTRTHGRTYRGGSKLPDAHLPPTGVTQPLHFTP